MDLLTYLLTITTTTNTNTDTTSWFDL